MLRRDIRFFMFMGSFILLIVALYQLRSTPDSEPSHPKPNIMDLNPKEKSRNLKSYVEGEHQTFEVKKYSLRDYVIRNVQQFVFFVGYARSGHSILASILDAHPNVVISHEYSLFHQWDDDPINHTDKSWLFSTLYDSSSNSVEEGLRRKESSKKGYSLAVPGWWQGKFDGIIDVIGDKSGGMTAQVYRKSKEHFKYLYQQLKNTIQMPIKVFHVVRNPYDNIATMILYNTHQKSKVNETHQFDDVDKLRQQITAYFNQVRSVIKMINEVPLDVIEVHNTDMISNPKGVMRTVCEALQIRCSQEYLHMCAKTVFVSESKSRHLVKWTPELLDMVADGIKSFKHLQRYSFSG
ncbi:uncharacterized protein LOC135333192 [Halichondria panicea]|uniref:uncharacterized protein LOC135333192 n=1 Tax=Halichondria panicea TaxID=6063 RepID=UPI00312B3DC0